MHRVVVVGTTGSGKTTFARAVAGRLGAPHFEIDAFSWGPNWNPRPIEEWSRELLAALEAPAWVVDGNYSSVRESVWGRADTVVWLDYSFARTFWQLFRRTIVRIVEQETLWSGNRESLRSAFLSRDSILLWLLRTYHRRRRSYARASSDPRWRHIAFVRLRSPRESATWLANVRAEPAPSLAVETRPAPSGRPGAAR